MAMQRADAIAEERAQVQALAEELMRLVSQVDPAATFSLDAPLDPGIWLLRAYVTPPLDSDPDFQRALAEREVDLQLRYGIAVATIPLPQRSGVE
jgi:hypothetical protein